MKIVNINETNHDFEKQNLVTLSDRKGLHDVFVCRNCGIKGKRYHLNSRLHFNGSFSNKRINNCPKAEVFTFVGKQVKVTQCTAYGERFSNLKSDTTHTIVKPPEGYKNDQTGVWVMGVGEPVKLLRSEYEFI